MSVSQCGQGTHGFTHEPTNLDTAATTLSSPSLSYREKKSHVEGIKQKVAGLTNFATIFTQVMNNRVENMRYEYGLLVS